MGKLRLRSLDIGDIGRLQHWGRYIAVAQSCLRYGEDMRLRELKKAIEVIYSPALLVRSVGFIAEHKEVVCGGALATEIASPINGQPEGLLHMLMLRRAWRSGDSAARLVEAVEAEAKNRSWRILRANVVYDWRDIVLWFRHATGWELASVAVCKRLEEEMPEALGRAPVKIRRALKKDMLFVQDLFSRALFEGLGPAERMFYKDEQIRDAAARKLAKVFRSDPVILIAEDEERLGHATAGLSVRQELTGKVEAVLYDTFVLPEYQGHGIATALTAGVEALAVLAGRRYINGFVYGKTTARTKALLVALSKMGWAPFQCSFRKVLR